MSSYVEGALVADERIVHEGRISLWSMWHLIALGIVTLPIVIGLFFLGQAYIRYKTTELAITSKRVIIKTGFIRRSTMELNLNKVESIQVDQAVMGRMFNFGTLIFGGTGTTHAPIVGIADPIEFRKAFIGAQDKVLTSA